MHVDLSRERASLDARAQKEDEIDDCTGRIGDKVRREPV
jgi:hypothetical protein